MDISWVLPTLVAVATIGYFLNRTYLTNLAQRLANDAAFSDQEGDPLGTGLLAPFVEGDCLEGDKFADGVAALLQYAKQVNPDWILGVHPGGRLLSVRICEFLNLDPTRCFFV